MNLQLLKNEIINAEKLAEENFTYEIEQDLFQIKKYMIDEEHYKELLSEYASNLINKYYKLNNFYKVNNEQFEFLNSKADNKMNDSDRHDLIIATATTFLSEIGSTKKDMESQLDLINQLENINDIVYETHLLKLKSEAVRSLIQKFNEKVEDKKNTNEKPFSDYYKSIISPSYFMEEAFFKEKSGIGWKYSYKSYLSSLKDNWNKQIENNQSYDKRIKPTVKRFIFNLITLSEKIVKLHEKVIDINQNNYPQRKQDGKGMSVKILLHDISLCFDRLNDYSSFLVSLKEEKKFIETIELQGFAIERIKRIIRRFKSEFYTDFEKSPFDYKFKETLSEIKEAIDREEIKMLMNAENYNNQTNELVENIMLNKENTQNVTEENNDIILSTIDDYFDDIRKQINDDDYEQLKNALKSYLEKGKFPTLKKKINLKRLSRKKIGWRINRILNSFGENVSKDVLSFAIDNISIYSTYKFDKPNYIDTSIYKSFHTNA